jgi:cell filamentation protein
MPYEAGKDPYLDPVTGVLRNLLGITTQEALEGAEADITTVEIVALTGEDLPILLDEYFNADLLREVHRQLFGGIYDWAGELRTVELSKGATSFARADHLAANLDRLMEELAADGVLRDLDRDAFMRRLAHYYAELIVLHPFREGNGRAIRTFLALLADNAGWFVAWDKMDPQANINASIAAYNGNEQPLQDIFGAIIASK